ncbi:hypothetical protein EDI_311760 [Entamoeba dispar SAW760]|uniref:Uncharacterized protein n=1 Tax=Entamoeba dispar (strain ATCC PRA-260 / SAW760) TaxID=370354 RepID=B0E9Z4_ENTDS|nr:uncharacterized protein EDI_311760 [Entamoeba dispar SAW760]EDR28643.1 hypothetical protein EDI_311760 [Entamoeba dispar SAW760]|eukprot:EDR28643.1 hypothetical protein EDI_311760 [Entamoeba dispar SAW760]
MSAHKNSFDLDVESFIPKSKSPLDIEQYNDLVKSLPLSTPQEYLDQIKYAYPCDREAMVDLVREIMQNKYETDFGEDDTGSFSDDDFDFISDDDLKEYENYLEHVRLSDELRDLQKTINEQNPEDSLVSSIKAKELANEYNKLNVFTHEEFKNKVPHDFSKKGVDYEINDQIVMAIGKIIPPEQLTLDRLVDYLDTFHIFGIVSEDLR